MKSDSQPVCVFLWLSNTFSSTRFYLYSANEIVSRCFREKQSLKTPQGGSKAMRVAKKIQTPLFKIGAELGSREGICQLPAGRRRGGEERTRGDKKYLKWKLCASKFRYKAAIVTAPGNKNKARKTHKGEPEGSSSRVTRCHEWHEHLFSYFHRISFKFPFCVSGMNIWSFPPEPVTDGPLKLGDAALCLWHCGIYRRKRSNSSAQREHEKVNTVSWRFTCLETLFVFKCSDHECLGATASHGVCFSGNDCLL